MSKPRVAFLNTGGTIARLGADALDVIDYGIQRQSLEAAELLARFPEATRDAEVYPVQFRSVPSSEIGFADWKDLAVRLQRLAREDPELAGIVVAHGTASMEETAYFLHLTLGIEIPVVLVGAQRPPSALSSDAGMNLVGAVRVAADARARGLGVLVVMNDEIHSAREVTKTSTLRVNTFASPDFGMLGQVDGDRVVFLRRPVAAFPLEAPFDLQAIEALPRVDIAYSYVGCDGVAVRAFIAAGALGLVAAGFAPGVTSPAQTEALAEAARAGIAVVQSSRVLSGRVPASIRGAEHGFIAAGNLNAQKARILLALALTAIRERGEIQRWFERH